MFYFFLTNFWFISFFSKMHDPFLFKNNYFISLIFIIISILLVILLILIPYCLSGRSLKTSEVTSEYECGFEPFDSAIRQPFTVEFYVIGILFLIFDVEITLVLPWSLVFSALPYQSIILMLFFLLLLAAGFLYEANLGVLEWGKTLKTSYVNKPNKK